jgi:dipeptidyl aminopeptidase/acylaminoacyl peptidase
MADPKRLTENGTAGAYLAPDRLVYVRQGTLMAQRLDVARGELTGDPETLADSVDVELVLQFAGFSVSGNGRVAYRTGDGGSQLTWYDRTGKTAGAAGEPDVITLQYAELSPDGRRVAVDRVVQSNRDVWLMDLERGGMTRFTFDAAADGFPLWSPDGMRIVFRSDRKGPGDLYVKPSNGAGMEELLLETPNDKSPQDWSRDGSFLLYSEQDPKAGGDLKALPITGNERKPVVVTNTPFNERSGQFSPDGRWVAYATDESGRYEIVVQPFPAPGGKWQVSISGGLQPRWRADGRELYFIAPDAKLMAASVNASAATFAAAAPVALFQTRILGGGTNLPSRPYYAVSRDGRFLILQSAGEAAVSPITLLQNWKPTAN